MRFFNKKEKQLTSPQPAGRGGWFPYQIFEPFTGAWQRNIEWKRESVLCYHAVFACITLIASDIAKLKPRIVREANGIWTEIPYGRFGVLQKPNNYQNRIQFFESWINSKLIRGNTYVLKERNGRGDIVSLHVLNPDLVLPIVSDDGQIFYQLGQDNLSGISQLGDTVPARDIIHDRFNCFFHPLVGLSPLFASGLPAWMGMKSLETSTHHFANGARPSGILTVPEAVSKDQAEELSRAWEEKYGGKNNGKVAILGGNVKYQPITTSAAENQMVELLRMTAEMVCSTFHVPSYKVIGNAPSYNNVEALEQAYYSQCLQILIESLEECLDEGFKLIGTDTGVEFDLDNLMRMDSKTQMETLSGAVKGGIMPPNQAMRRLNLKPVEGGDTVYLQQQMFSLEALAKRDAQENPFETGAEEVIVEEPVERSLSKVAFALRKDLLQ